MKKAVESEIFVGDPQDFALRLAFCADPDEGTAAALEQAVSWGPARLPGVPDGFRFIESRGHARLDVDYVANTLYQALTWALEYLTEKLPESEELADLFSRAKRLKETPYTDRLTWLCGLGTQFDQARDNLRALLDRIRLKGTHVSEAILGSETQGNPLVLSGSCQAALMFGSLSPTITLDDVMALADLLIGLYVVQEDNHAFTGLPYSSILPMISTKQAQVEPACVSRWLTNYVIYSSIGIKDASWLWPVGLGPREISKKGLTPLQPCCSCLDLLCERLCI